MILLVSHIKLYSTSSFTLHSSLSVICGTFSGSEVVGGIDNEVRSVDIVTLGDGFEQFGVVNGTLL